ncbi:MAG: hypothetical protein MH252_17630 [Thermosynechococcaceae cyanobacterium MS004]|nr:hypothetical protein [Thermosynechococcaceae cyanobacterium MS004]
MQPEIKVHQRPFEQVFFVSGGLSLAAALEKFTNTVLLAFTPFRFIMIQYV